MLQMEAGTVGAGPARTRASRVIRLFLPLVALSVVAVGALAYLVLVIVPSASAAGGCGGG
jgi:hypothetical protein